MTTDDWLEGDASADSESVPLRDLTKHEVSLATGYPLAAIDRLVRLGLPHRPGASKRAGLRFDLPAVIEWIAEHRAASRGGPDDSTAAAKRRSALAYARRQE